MIEKIDKFTPLELISSQAENAKLDLAYAKQDLKEAAEDYAEAVKAYNEAVHKAKKVSSKLENLLKIEN